MGLTHINNRHEKELVMMGVIANDIQRNKFNKAFSLLAVANISKKTCSFCANKRCIAKGKVCKSYTQVQ